MNITNNGVTMINGITPGHIILWAYGLFYIVAGLYFGVLIIIESLKPKPPKPPVFLGPRQNLELQQRIDHPFTFHLQRKRRRPRMSPRLGPRQNLELQQRIDDKKFIKNAIRTGIIHKDFEKWLRD
jgi:hypothetical protein